MVRSIKYSDEFIDEAVTRHLAGETYASISEDMGCSRPSISRWVAQHKEELGIRRKPKEDSFSAELAQKREEAANLAVMRAMSKFEQTQAILADELLETAREARNKIVEAFQKGPGDKAWAAWLRAVVGALDYLIKNGQLLSGGPTNREESRAEVTQRHDPAVEHILRDEDAREQVRQLFRQASRRNVEGDR